MVPKRCSDIKGLKSEDCCDSCHEGEEDWGDYMTEYRDKSGVEWEVCCKAKEFLKRRESDGGE
jgi:hypothetical protein